MSGDPALVGVGAGPRLLFNVLFAIALVLIYAPAVYLLLASFNPGMQLGLVPPDQLSLNWYVALAGERRLMSALVESVIVGAATAVVATPIGLSAALAFAIATAVILFLSAILILADRWLKLSRMFEDLGT